MSGAPPQDGDPIELSCTLGPLRITISGPADQATDLLHYITHRGAAPAPTASSEGSFELVASEQVPPAASSSTTTSTPVVATPVLETRDSIEASFVPCPGAWLQVRIAYIVFPGNAFNFTRIYPKIVVPPNHPF